MQQKGRVVLVAKKGYQSTSWIRIKLSSRTADHKYFRISLSRSPPLRPLQNYMQNYGEQREVGARPHTPT